MDTRDEWVTLTIDDKEVRVPAGTLVLHAAAKVGIEIPTLCYYARLSPFGACRMCLVEIERMRGLQTACTTPVREGMVVRTNTPQVIKARRAMLEFLLTNHPLDCPICDKGGECELQDLVYKYGATESRFIEPKRHKRKARPLSETIIMDEERCVLCRRCIRFLAEWAGDPQLEVFERGRLTYVDVFPGTKLDSPFAGNVVDICPVGALTSRPFRFKARVWELEEIPSICTLCGVGCNVTLGVRNRRLLRVTARTNRDVNSEWLCDRGRFGQGVWLENRVMRPLLRRGEAPAEAGHPTELTQEEVDWDKALGFVAARLRAIVEAHGPNAVGGWGSAQASNETNYLLQKLMRAVVGTNNVDYPGRLPEMAYLVTPDVVLGQARVVLLLGLDLLDESPIVELFLRRIALTRGTQLIVAYPEKPSLARFGEWLPCRRGTETALVRGMIHVLLQEGLSVAEADLEQARHLAEGHSPERVAELTGTPVEAIQRAARSLAKARWNGIIAYQARLVECCIWPEQRQRNGAVFLEAVSVLAQLAGSVAPCYIAPAVNSVGALDMGVAPHLYPGPVPINGEARKKLGWAWASAAPRQPTGDGFLPDVPGLTTAEMLEQATQGKFHGLYVVESGSEGVLENLDEETKGKVKAALSRLELLCVQGTHLTELARMAHVVLPVGSPLESAGTYTNLRGRVQRALPALPLPGEARHATQVLAAVAAALGGNLGSGDPAAVMREIAQVVSTYRGLTYEAVGPLGRPRG